MKKRIVTGILVLIILLCLGAVAVSAQTESYCQHCRENVQWKPLSQGISSKNVLVSGHYYADQPLLSTVTVRASAQVCLDLQGLQVRSEYGRLFSIGSGATLSIQDSVGGGSLAGAGYVNNIQNGGTVSVDTGAVLNLYSGTLTNALKDGQEIYNGGVVFVKGTFAIYGGAVENGVCSKSGGNIYVNEGGHLGIHGGRITGGTATAGHTACGMVRGTLALSGAPEIEKLRLWPKEAQGDGLTVSGSFTGHVVLYVDGAAQGVDIGNVTDGGSFGPENIRILGQKIVAYISGTDILLGQKAAAIYGNNGFEGYTDTLQAAIEVCQGTDKTVALYWECGEENTANQDLKVDLRGYRWQSLTVAEGATLYLKDSGTDDYKGNWGQIDVFSGSAKPQSGYQLYREDTCLSAHAYSMNVTEAVLRPSIESMYFVGRFRGDDRLKTLVYSYGIVVDATQIPNPSTLNATSQYTSIRDGLADEDGVNSVLLRGIMKAANSRMTNSRNADLAVYCRPYIRFQDGTYAWGEVRQISFRELVEKADALWTPEAVPTDLQAMYRRFPDEMGDWNIPNVKKAVQTGAPSPYRVFTPMTEQTINSLPIATADMTESQLRQLCADFFRMQLTFQWVSESDIGYDIRGRHLILPAGTVYAGSPYSDRAKSGNLYMTMEFYDQQTGVLTNPGMSDRDFVWLFGNHCTYGPFWGWARVINSMTTQWNVNMGLEMYGYIPLGDFTTEGIETWKVGVHTTKMIKEAAGEQAIYEGYAQTELADCLYTWYGDAVSHMRMVSQKPVVVRNEDGTINGQESYLLYMDQGGTWRQRNVGGDVVRVQGGLDDKVTFAQLYEDHYLAFTFKEFHGLDPVEKSVTTSTLDGLKTVTPEALAEATVSCNYAISHVTVSVTHGEEEVYRGNAFSPRVNTLEMGISDAVDEEKLAQLRGQHITVTCRIGTGEIITLLDGTVG